MSYKTSGCGQEYSTDSSELKDVGNICNWKYLKFLQYCAGGTRYSDVFFCLNPFAGLYNQCRVLRAILLEDQSS